MILGRKTSYYQTQQSGHTLSLSLYSSYLSPERLCVCCYLMCCYSTVVCYVCSEYSQRCFFYSQDICTLFVWCVVCGVWWLLWSNVDSIWLKSNTTLLIEEYFTHSFVISPCVCTCFRPGRESLVPHDLAERQQVFELHGPLVE